MKHPSELSQDRTILQMSVTKHIVRSVQGAGVNINKHTVPGKHCPNKPLTSLLSVLIGKYRDITILGTLVTNQALTGCSQGVTYSTEVQRILVVNITRGTNRHVQLNCELRVIYGDIPKKYFFLKNILFVFYLQRDIIILKENRI